MARLGALLSFVLLFLSFALAEPPSDSKVPPTRDDTAVQLLHSMNAACGWSAFAPQTVVATGTITIDGKAEPVVVEAKPGWLRVQRPQTDVVFVVHGSLGTVTSQKETTWLGGGEASSSQPWMFPFYSEVMAVNDPNYSVSLGSKTSVGNAPAQSVGMEYATTLDDGLDWRRQTASNITIAISTDFLPLQVTFSQMAHDTDHLAVSADAYLSDFRKVDGVLTPFHYEQWIGKQNLFAMQFDTVTFDVAVQDSDFNLF